jgi:lysophospholipase L1-like esterase
MRPRRSALEQARELFPEVPWRRYVALGDSITEGVLGDEVEGYPPGGWVTLVGEAFRTIRPDFEYTNLGKRYATTAQIREQQVPRAVELQPDLITVVAGGNDILTEKCDVAASEQEFEKMIVALQATGATVVTSTMFDIFTAGILYQEVIDTLAPRFRALTDAVIRVAERHGVPVVDLSSDPASADPGIYSKDLQHANTRGQAVAAELILDGLAEVAAPLSVSSSDF